MSNKRNEIPILMDERMPLGEMWLVEFPKPNIRTEDGKLVVHIPAPKIVHKIVGLSED